MELLKFYRWFGVFVEVSLIIPVGLGLFSWRKLSIELKVILTLLLVELGLNVISIYYALYIKKNNLFLSYFYTFFWDILIMFFLYRVSNHARSILVFMFLGVLFLLWEYVLSQDLREMNYYSAFFINLTIFVFSIRVFFELYNLDMNAEIPFHNPKLLILLGLSLQFFFRTADAVFKKQLFQSGFYSHFWYYEFIIYYFFMMLVTGVYSYAFYLLKNEN